MSGIFGIVRAHEGADLRAELAPMRDAMEFWGRDGERTWVRDRVALAHRMQTVTGSRGRGAGAALPELHGVTVAADVRLDNADELRGLLRMPASACPTDEEVLLHAYRHWGEACVERLAGAFAFAVWDARRERLVCARDHAGFRPFTYSDSSEGFVFASDAEAVVACPGVARRPDEEVLVARYVRNTPMLRERSFFEGVRKLPAGELLVVEPGRGGRRRRHWLPERIAPDERGSADEHAHDLRETLLRAVARAVDSDARVGAHLSGGLDSSAVSVLAQQALNRDGRSLSATFSWSPPADPGASAAGEHERVEAVASMLGVPVSYTVLGEADLLANASRDEALEPNMLLLYEDAVLAEAARRGVGVLLCGWGGDEAASFGGRGQLAWLARRGRWVRLCREAAALARRDGRSPVAKFVLGRIVYEALPPLLPDFAFHGLRMGENPVERELRRRGEDWTALHPLAMSQRQEVIRTGRLAPSPNATQRMLLLLGHLECRIESWARAGARHGIDHRYPLLDRDVVELCLAMPPDVWLRDGWSRWVFRKAVDPFLDPSIVWAPAKEEPARVRAWRDLVTGAPLAAPPDASALVRGHLRRQRAIATLLMEQDAAAGRPRA